MHTFRIIKRELPPFLGLPAEPVWYIQEFEKNYLITTHGPWWSLAEAQEAYARHYFRQKNPLARP